MMQKKLTKKDFEITQNLIDLNNKEDYINVIAFILYLSCA